MKIIKSRPLSEVRGDVTKEQLEQDITDLEISQMEQEQEITDHDIAIMELQEALINK
ncbi:MAG: hypothetical protein IJL91_07050 [Bacteroidales bacterium]|nr:hypothetical protein [Bacteroidales bacterium]